MKKIILIDTFGFFFKSYYAIPKLVNKDGFPTGLLTGFANLLSSIFKDEESYTIFALESKTKLLRKEFFPEYKANRKDAPEDLKMQLGVALEWVTKMDLNLARVEGYEADDVIASLATSYAKSGHKVEIVSSDKDLYQLIDSNIYLYDPTKKIDIHEKECLEKFKVHPSEFITYQSIVGDSSDNIPGIKGIGPTGALKILEKFKSLEELYACTDLESIFGKRMASLITEGKELAFTSRKLVTLDKNLNLTLDLKPTHNPLLKIKDELVKYDLKKVLQNIDKTQNPTKDSSKAQSTSLFGESSFEKELPRSQVASDFILKTKLILDEDELLSKLSSIPKDTPIGFDIETTGLNVREDILVGFSFATSDVGYYVPCKHSYINAPTQISKETLLKALNIIFSHPLIGHNLKFDLQVIESNFNLSYKGVIQDSMILAWLIDPSGYVGLDACMKRYFNHDMIKFDSLFNKKSKYKDFSNIEVEDASLYAGEDALATLKLFNKLKDLIEKPLLDLAYSLEFPFIKTIMSMEKLGIHINKPYFQKLLNELNEKLASLTEKIHALSPVPFNINSTKQLGEVLYERLGLQSSKKTKTGFSTDETSLKALLGKHQMIPYLLEYRELTKITSTYLEPFLNSEGSIIHTQFIQTGTSTGRLASKNPNLQNIPVKTELGLKVREGFVASSKEKVLLSLDYSQIELRLLAHFSQDPSLVHAFLEGKDIHLQSASLIFGDEQAMDKRYIAKTINFGLIYGMGARKLAASLGITQAQAKSYIESYFAKFPTVKNYLNNLKEEILEKGYTYTLLGRKRYFDFHHANDFERANFLREGVNALFQGSAADLIKLSMNKIMESNIKASMLLQIHDELVFEVDRDDAKEVAKSLQDIMTNIYKLKVPLLCNTSIGNTLAELKL
ncbi:DNA polymerase I [Helicobacter sp. 13S00401-1]|uniref:DNA polymerase I n=1 Tax=Helicobacter sp. 13S00401-1 TaxID=1905758 RepID=UPI000BA6CF8A|nr:DNA polymerase I [Helicobacter sp. 13S00401-1]PAF51690.1 DNA polymerase I [Helicobacter sp. 13S00401-1]